MTDKIGPPQNVVYSRDAMGHPVKITGPDAEERTAAIGNRPIGEQEAVQGAQAQKDLSYVDQNWGALGQGAYGAFKGLTLGLGPGALVQAGLLDPNHAGAADVSPYAVAGDIAGTVAPALLSGGESLAARGLAATPAGLLPRVGSVAERIAAGFLDGEAPGLLGRAALQPIKMAARGAAEGALLNVGHQIGDNLVQNKPFAAEALAAMGDGALFGGLIGGGLGTAGMIGSAAVDSMGQIARRVASGADNGLERVAGSLGEDISGLGKEEAKALLKRQGSALEEMGSRVGDTPTGKYNAAKKYTAAQESIRQNAVKTLEDNAPLATPGFSNIDGRLETEVASKYNMSPMRGTALKEIAKVREELQSLWPLQDVPEVNVPAQTEQRFRAGSSTTDKYGKTTGFKPSGYDTVETAPGYKIPGMQVPSEAVPTWKELIKFRDEFASTATSQIRKDVLSIIDSEIGNSMTKAGLEYGAAAANAAKEYSASSSALALGKQMEANLGRLANRTDLGTGGFGAITSRDLGTAGGMALGLGRPASAATWLASKSVGRVLTERTRPWLAQMAYDQSIANKAATATVNVKSRIGKALDSFFKTAAKTPEKTAQAGYAATKSRGEPITRQAYEAEASRIQQLLSDNHAERVNEMASKLADEGHQALAAALLDMNQRAVLYITNAMPQRQGAKAMQSLRPVAVSKVPTMQEHKFMRVTAGLDPMKMLEHFEDGSLSREEVRTAWTVYPEFKQEFVAQAIDRVAAMKAKGQSLSLDKINTLGVMLDTAIDRIHEKDYVSSVQMALNAPPANAPPGPAPHQPANMTVQSTGLMTPLQQNLMG